MISHRVLESVTAILTAAFGTAVTVSSLDNGIGWSANGVDAGTFPFLVGLIIVAGSVVNLARGVIVGGTAVISRGDLGRLAELFVPAAIYVGAIPLLGMYLATGGYMLGGLLLRKRISFVRAIIIAVATPVALYLIFDRAFQVTLPRGALSDWLGF